MNKNNILSKYDSATLLCDLPDSEFVRGGMVDSIVREAGYSSGRAFVNEMNIWGETLGDFVMSEI